SYLPPFDFQCASNEALDELTASPYIQSRTDLVPRSFNRQWLVNAWAGRPVGQLPRGRVNGAGDFLHIFVFNLFERIRRAVIILMHPVHVKDDRDSLPRVVVMVAAIKEPLGVVRVVILEVE